MPTRVRFRFNKSTGEVEEFLVDDQDRTLPEAEHDRRAAMVAREVTLDPLITAVNAPAAPAAPRDDRRTTPPAEPATRNEDEEPVRRES